ncbi:hypothetical protein [Brevundimonas sp. R86498]|uniref:hypothetical protein n=1 Tax=Brevundimonas sp. R86498 TaxID=3093845 RepID=UPI0037CC5366
MTRLFLIPALSLGLIGAACSDAPDAVEATSPGAAPAEVSDNRAMTAATSAALALGMTREQLEDADLLSPAPGFADLGDVETLVLDGTGQVTGLVIDLEGSDVDVVLPIEQVTSVRRENDVDLVTPLGQAQLQAMPAYTGPAT